MVDLATGPSACGLDFEAAFLAGVLLSQKEGPRLLVADGSGSEGAALSEASAGAEASASPALSRRRAARGVKAQRLTREGGKVRLVRRRAATARQSRPSSARRPERHSRGQSATAAGPHNPARFAAGSSPRRDLRHAAARESPPTSSSGSRGGDGLGFAACLWAWRLGLPMPGIVLSVSEKGILGLDPSGRELVDRFDAERPGVIRSLALLQSVDRRPRSARARSFRRRAARISTWPPPWAWSQPNAPSRQACAATAHPRSKRRRPPLGVAGGPLRRAACRAQ